MKPIVSVFNIDPWMALGCLVIAIWMLWLNRKPAGPYIDAGIILFMLFVVAEELYSVI